MGKRAEASTPVGERIAADLDRYAGYGIKASGGPGDTATGNWLASELTALGFAVERQPISVPFFTADIAVAETGAARADIIPQAVTIPTGAEGIAGPLVRVDVATAAARASDLHGAIALADLPFARWSSLAPIRSFVAALFDAGARAVLLVTNGPTGQAIALNCDGDKPMFSGPVAILAPEAAAPFHVAAQRGETARLRIAGQGGRRPAFNLIGRLERGGGRWLAVSTPRSGWFACAGERGPGVAIWLGLARWAARTLPGHDLAFLCNSGHEYENLGAEEALARAAPDPRSTALWIHLGSNLATRDWHDLRPPALPLTTADPQRCLVASPSLVAVARRAFAGQPGLADPRPSTEAADGETKAVIAAGYPAVVGVYGAHRFHHVREDDRRCLLPDATAAALLGFQDLILSALAE